MLIKDYAGPQVIRMDYAGPQMLIKNYADPQGLERIMRVRK